MIRHLLRLAWNRKAKNALLSFELLIAFLVLMVVTLIGVATLSYMRMPLGFDPHDVLVLQVQDGVTDEMSARSEARQGVRNLIDTLREVPGVRTVAAATSAPMTGSENVSRMAGRGGAPVEFNFDEVTDEFHDALDLSLTAGRWFGADDDASADAPVVINERLARSVFGTGDPVGQDLLGDAPMEPGERRLRVVGVVSDYRHKGDLGLPRNFLFHRVRLDDPEQRAPSVLLIEYDEAAQEGLQKRLEDRARAVAPDVGLALTSLSALRAESQRLRLAPLLAVGLVAAFLLSMVGLGLAGVFWQSIAQRRAEIGLRRAAGATARGVMGQIVGEVWAMVTLVVAVGLVLVAQAPLFGLARTVGPGVFVAAVATAVAMVYLLALLAALAPAALAARVQPAEALRAE